MSTLKEMVFIDRNVTDLNTLLAGMRSDVDTVLLTGEEPAILQIARTVQGREQLSAIHIIAHGRAGEISFDAGALSIETLNEYSVNLAEIGQALAKDGDVLLWSCHTGAGERGASFIGALAQKLGTAVAAATDLVGAAVLGGCWRLDKQIGAVTAGIPVTAKEIAGYSGVMAAFTGTSGDDTANATTSTRNGFTGGTTSQLTDSTGDTFSALGGNDIIVAGSGNDTINGGSGNDAIDGGAGADSLTGGSGTDSFSFTRGDTVLNIGGSGTSGTISGYDVITDLASSETLNFTASTTVAANVTVNGSNSSLILHNGNSVSSHRISNGIITFDDTGTFGSAVSLTSLADVAAVVDYLQINSSYGKAVAFTATVSGTNHTYVYRHSNSDNELLIDLENVTSSSLTDDGSSHLSLNAVPSITFSNVALSSDTGTSSTDFITKTAAQTITATLSVASAVTDIVYGSLDNGSNWTNITNKVSGTTLTWDGVTLVGSNTLKLKVTDNSGNDRTVSSQAYVLDTAAPTVNSIAITSAAGIQNSTVNAGDVVSVSVNMNEVALVTGTPQLDLNIGGTLVQADYASGSGSATLEFTYTILAGQVDANGIRITANSLALNGGTINDSAGNAATLAHTWVDDNAGYLVDTVAPNAPSTPDLAVASDTGSSNTDNLTNDTTATLIGTAEPGSTVTIYDGATARGSSVADISGNYSITTSALSSGVRTLTAKAADAAGNVSSASGSLSVTVDSTAPSATCVTTGTIQDTASAIVKSTEVGTAYLVNNSLTVANLASITGAADNLWNWVTIGVAATNTSLAAVGLSTGTYNVYTVDAAGNLSSASTSVGVNSDFTASATTATIQNTTNATVQSSRIGTAYLVKNTIAVSTETSITNAADNSWNSVAITAANTNTALAATGLVDGIYKVYAVDTNGNLSTVASNLVTVDTTAPLATLVSATINDTANATVKSSEVGTAYLVKSTVNVTTLASIISADTALWNTVAITAANTNTNLAATGLLTGSYKLYTTDAAGNLSLPSTASVSIADTTAPTASVNSATMQNTASASVQSTEVGTAYLVKSTVAVTNLASITSAADSSWNSVTVAIPNASTLLPASGLTDGTYKVYTIDAANNLSIASTNSVTIDSTAPTVTATAATIQSTANATFNSNEAGTAYLVNSTVTVTNLASITTADGSLWNSVAIKTADVGVNTSIAATRLVNGTYHVYAVDKAGNVSLPSSNSVTVFTPAIEITQLGNTSFIINGESPDGLSGVSVASAGDVNGDGLDDLIVGGFNSNPSAGDWASRSYVVFGQTATTAINLSAITAGTGGFVINGDVTNNLGGVSVASAGDVNADGLADLIVGDTGGVDTALDTGGHSYVIFGKTDTTAVNLSSLGSGGFTINGQATGDQSGISVASAGDVNGDGLSDVLVGAFQSDPTAGTDAGRSYVVFGKANATAVNLSSVAVGSGGFVINGQSANDLSGISVASAGDVNGDGLADLIVGAFQSDPAAVTDAGRSYVVFGKADTTAVNLSAIAPATGTPVGGFVINGQSANDLSGYSVASAGDVNADGLADLIVGAFQSDPTAGTDAGRSYVIFGKTGTTAVNLSTLGTGGFVINGQSANDGSGISVASAGDFNGDGLADLLIGASQATPSSTRASAGRTYLVFGKTDTTAVNLSSVAAGTGGFVINGDNKEDYSGLSVAAAGDVNADGFADLIVGAPQNDAIASDAGRSYVIFGSNSNIFAQTGANPAMTLTGTTASERLTGKNGNDTLTGNDGADVLYGGRGNDLFQLSADNVAKLALSVTSGTLARVDGGSGLDTLALSGAGITLDLTTIKNQMIGSRIESIERIDLSGTGNNILTLAAADVLDMSGMNQFNNGNGWTGAGASVGRHQLVIDGDGGDLVSNVLSGWTAPGTTVTNGSNSYNVYNSTSTLAQLLINTTVAISTASSANNDLLTGTAGVDTLSGLAGNDFILGLAGNDTIDGGTGNDTITGGVGKDTITTGTGNDTLVFATADITDAAGNGYDVCSDLVLNGASADRIDLPVAVANIGTAVSGTINWSSFVTSMNSILSVPGAGFNTTVAGTITATIVTDTPSNSKYLVVDMNGNDQFNQSGVATDDFIILLGSTVPTLTTGTFI